MSVRKSDNLYGRIREILDFAKSHVARSVNSTQVAANWLIGREIVEEEQQGQRRANYGEGVMKELSRRLTRDYGRGFSLSLLKDIKTFYIKYPGLLKVESTLGKGPAVRGLSPSGNITSGKGHALRGLFAGATKGPGIARSAGGESAMIEGGARRMQREAWKPGLLHPNLSWTHYRTLLRVDDAAARSFYEIEAVKNAWPAREMERQINSLLYERLALSKDKKGLLRLAAKGHEVQKPADVFKDPMVIEFLGLPESPKLVETDLEQALIDNLQAFLLELGKGFAFVARQERLTIDGDHFYIDLVFYHTILKCFILLDLKVGKLTHEDLGQLQLYVNYYDAERLTDGDKPTLGLILCADKNHAVIQYTLANDPQSKIFASRYKLHVPSAATLRAEVRRELRMLQAAAEVGR